MSRTIRPSPTPPASMAPASQAATRYLDLWEANIALYARQDAHAASGVSPVPDPEHGK